jgi:hypothetical protein
LRAGLKSQPRVQEITLLDRFDDRWVGAFEFQGCNPVSMQDNLIIDPKAEIFNENLKMQRNSVNDCFPFCLVGLFDY